jgi:hypothetical protein
MTKTLRVATAIQAALFNVCIRPEFTRKEGKWATKNQAKAVADWKDVEAVVADNDNLGRDFDAHKTNFNVNDSTWVNQEPVTKKMIRVATQAAGRKVEKKEVVAELVALKGIFAQKAA